ncbi:hypothetical protein DXG03_001514 [Asterophora parasitica]|uniref:PUM-HD domain-containing protein n=1 Tax=Asterophora parasitica TaxID=117018 RepID=A0A9P7G9V1_9AGAR|nr:hypothetical protein DXG03_001514 [Asterophora parasitica]
MQLTTCASDSSGSPPPPPGVFLWMHRSLALRSIAVGAALEMTFGLQLRFFSAWQQSTLTASIWAPQPQPSDITWPKTLDNFSRVAEREIDSARSEQSVVRREDVFGPIPPQIAPLKPKDIGAIGDGRKKNSPEFEDTHVEQLLRTLNLNSPAPTTKKPTLSLNLDASPSSPDFSPASATSSLMTPTDLSPSMHYANLKLRLQQSPYELGPAGYGIHGQPPSLLFEHPSPGRGGGLHPHHEPYTYLQGMNVHGYRSHQNYSALNVNSGFPFFEPFADAAAVYQRSPAQTQPQSQSQTNPIVNIANHSPLAATTTTDPNTTNNVANSNVVNSSAVNSNSNSLSVPRTLYNPNTPPTPASAPSSAVSSRRLPPMGMDWRLHPQPQMQANANDWLLASTEREREPSQSQSQPTYHSGAVGLGHQGHGHGHGGQGHAQGGLEALPGLGELRNSFVYHQQQQGLGLGLGLGQGGLNMGMGGMGIGMAQANGNGNGQGVGMGLHQSMHAPGGGAGYGGQGNGHAGATAVGGGTAPMTTSSPHSQAHEPINFLSLLHPSSSPPYAVFVERIIKSSDQQASIFLQQKLKVADLEERAKIVDAICARGFEMMAHRFGNWAVQRCLEAASVPEERRKIVACMRGRVVELATNCYGCHVLQKALDCEEDVRLLIVSELLLGDPAQTLVNKHASHVWSKIMELSWTPPAPPIFAYVNKSLKGNWASLACHETGSLVVQHAFENLEDEAKDGIVDELINNGPSVFAEVAKNQWGSYCIQHILEHGSEAHRAQTLQLLLDGLLDFATSEQGAKSVTKALKEGGKPTLDRIVERMCEAAKGSRRAMIVDLALSVTGSQLIASVLPTVRAVSSLPVPADKDQRALLYDCIRSHIVTLRGCKTGSKVIWLL